MDLPHHVKHENLSTFIVLLWIFVLICWVCICHFHLFLDAQANHKKQRVIEKVIYCDFCHFSVGLLEEKIAVQKVDWKHHLEVVHKLCQLKVVRGNLEIVVENFHIFVVKFILIANLSPMLFHYDELLLSQVQIPIKVADLILVK